MAHRYAIKTDDTQIKIGVLVSTGGEATTTVRKVMPDSTWLLLTSSPDADGIVPEEEIGTSAELAGRTLKIKTIIELDLIPEHLRPNMIANLVIDYTLSGGVNGAETFSYAEADKRASDDKLLVLVMSTINLVTL